MFGETVTRGMTGNAAEPRGNDAERRGTRGTASSKPASRMTHSFVDEENDYFESSACSRAFDSTRSCP
jgi:hypothetical protein